MTHQVTIEEEQRQLILLALATLSVERPGFDYALRGIAARLPDARGEDMYRAFLDNLRDEPAAPPAPPAQEERLRTIFHEAWQTVRHRVEQELLGQGFDAATLELLLRHYASDFMSETVPQILADVRHRARLAADARKRGPLA